MSGLILLGWSEVLERLPLHEVLSGVLDDADIRSRCIKMASSKFDVFMSLSSSMQSVQTSASSLARWHRGEDETV